jgi:UDP-GlcNAc:undecaprenyl-phosphate GlcNAc-1-phosphate transferase
MIWFVAIPLLDCIGLIFARLKKGKSISSPGRDHIHHKLMNRYSPEGTLVIIIDNLINNRFIGIFLNNAFFSLGFNLFIYCLRCMLLLICLLLCKY